MSHSEFLPKVVSIGGGLIDRIVASKISLFMGDLLQQARRPRRNIPDVRIMQDQLLGCNSNVTVGIFRSARRRDGPAPGQRSPLVVSGVSRLAQQLRQLGDVGGDALGLVAGELGPRQRLHG